MTKDRASGVTSPEKFFGFKMGADKKIARWDRIVQYFQQLNRESENIEVEEVGKSTEGNPFLVVYISSKANLRELERYREINARISDPRGLNQDEARRLVSEGKAVVVQSMSLHANEIGGTQMAPELAYELIATDNGDNRRILEQVIFIMIPCFNPDGEIMVTDWYNKWLDTEFEGCNMPWLFHKYAGHDNNRDAFYQNLVESRYVGEILFRKWHPQVYQDHHHMGSYGPRLYIAPYSNPIRPNADPLVWREHEAIGGYMAYALEQEGKQGVISGGGFSGWGHYGFHWITNHHNIAGMLTESASAKLASPLYVNPEQLQGYHANDMPEYEAQVNFPSPWPGGWWHLRDVVEQQKISAWALLDFCAKHRQQVLWNAYQKARNQIDKGLTGEPRAYVINPDQHDPLAAQKLAELLLLQGIELKEANSEFSIGRKAYPMGTYVVSLRQPKMGVIKNLLGRTFFPDNKWTRLPDGSFAVFDTATDTLAEFMGVDVEQIDSHIEGDFEIVREIKHYPGVLIGGGRDGIVIDPRLNDSFKVVNNLLSKGVEVYRLSQPTLLPSCEPKRAYSPSNILPPGAFYVRSDNDDALERAMVPGVNGYAFALKPEIEKTKIRQRRVGVFQRYWGGNADEGWTRFLLEKYGFDFVTIRDRDVRDGLGERVDLLILPCDNYKYIVDLESKEGPPLKMYWPMKVPDEYRSGLGEDVSLLKDFVQEGGRLVAFGESCEVAIKALGLKVENLVSGLSPEEYFCQGNTMWVDFDIANPLAYGMPSKAVVMCWDSPVFKIKEDFNPENYHTIGKFPNGNILQSGLLVGEGKIAGQSAMVSVDYGCGQVILIGFRPQFRVQTDGTFKIVFNCLV